MLVDHRHEARHEFVPLVVREPSQRHVAAKVLIAVGVAAGTPQRTFTRDLDREIRTIPLEDQAPGLEVGPLRPAEGSQEVRRDLGIGQLQRPRPLRIAGELGWDARDLGNLY